jgi:hypothetical protein
MATDEKRATAKNLMWKWYSHLRGEEAFVKSFPAKRCDDPLWQIMDAAIRDQQSRNTRPKIGSFNFRTFTDRLIQAAGGMEKCDNVSPASIKMIQYEAPGYQFQDIPKVTKDAMLAWIHERSRAIDDFAKFFDEDEKWHPYQVCCQCASSTLWNLGRALNEAMNPKKEEASA